MYSVVILQDKTRLCVPVYWVFAINTVDAYRSGVNRNEKGRIFFSKDENATPNFLLPVRSKYCADKNSCYLGQILNVFGTKAECEMYLNKHRIILPPVYDEFRKQKGDRSTIANEQSVQQRNEQLVQVKQETERELEPLRKALRLLNALAPLCDLTKSDENNSIPISDDEPDDQPEEFNEISMNNVATAQVVLLLHLKKKLFHFLFKSFFLNNGVRASQLDEMAPVNSDQAAAGDQLDNLPPENMNDVAPAIDVGNNPNDYVIENLNPENMVGLAAAVDQGNNPNDCEDLAVGGNILAAVHFFLFLSSNIRK